MKRASRATRRQTARQRCKETLNRWWRARSKLILGTAAYTLCGVGTMRPCRNSGPCFASPVSNLTACSMLRKSSRDRLFPWHGMFWPAFPNDPTCGCSDRCTLQIKKSLQALGVGISRDAALGDDGRHIAIGSHVKGRVAGADVIRGGLDSSPMRYLLGRALLDGNFVSRGQFQVNGRKRRRHVERNLVLARQHSHRVSADLVGHVAIGGDAVCTHNHSLDFRLLHK